MLNLPIQGNEWRLEPVICSVNTVQSGFKLFTESYPLFLFMGASINFIVLGCVHTAADQTTAL
jgi:hypothetical protein